jgi:hypothetical protein
MAVVANATRFMIPPFNDADFTSRSGSSQQERQQEG